MPMVPLTSPTKPAVIFVPKLIEERWYIVQIGDHFDEIILNVGGTKANTLACM